MGEKRLTNSELRLNRLEEEDSHRVHEPGILELFDDGEAEPHEDAQGGRNEEGSRRGGASSAKPGDPPE